MPGSGNSHHWLVALAKHFVATVEEKKIEFQVPLGSPGSSHFSPKQCSTNHLVEGKHGQLIGNP